jgi:hypothetical protein
MYAKDYLAYSKKYKKHCPKDVDSCGPIPANIDAIYAIPFLPQTEKKDTVMILSDAARKLCRKYRLRFPIDPDVQYHESDILRLRSPLNYFNAREFMQNLRNASTEMKIDLNQIRSELASYQDGRLVVMIDFAFSKDQIRAEFEKLLNDWSSKSRERLREIVIDKWKVYDLRENENKSFINISIELKGSKGKPTKNGFDDAYLQEVKRAYKKACQIIASVEKHAKIN